MPHGAIRVRAVRTQAVCVLLGPTYARYDNSNFFRRSRSAGVILLPLYAELGTLFFRSAEPQRAAMSKQKGGKKVRAPPQRAFTHAAAPLTPALKMCILNIAGATSCCAKNVRAL